MTVEQKETVQWTAQIAIPEEPVRPVPPHGVTLDVDGESDANNEVNEPDVEGAGSGMDVTGNHDDYMMDL